MLIYYAVGRLGVQLARQESQSALPNARVTEPRQHVRTEFRTRTARALHRLADRIGPVDGHAGRGLVQQA